MPKSLCHLIIETPKDDAELVEHKQRRGDSVPIWKRVETEAWSVLKVRGAD